MYKPIIEPVKVRGGTETLYVREMSWKERNAFEEKTGIGGSTDESEKAPDGFAEWLVVFTACKEDGELMFGGGREEVESLPAPVFFALFKASNRLNSIADGTVESERKNS